MKKIILIVFISVITLSELFANEPFGQRLSSPATIQVVNNLMENPRAFSLTSPFASVLGIYNTGVISEMIRRMESVNIVTIYSNILVFNRNFIFILTLQDGHEYLIRIEGEETSPAITKIDITTGIIQNIQLNNFWE